MDLITRIKDLCFFFFSSFTQELLNKASVKVIFLKFQDNNLTYVFDK